MHWTKTARTWQPQGAGLPRMCRPLAWKITARRERVRPKLVV